MEYLFHYTSFNTLKLILENNTLLFNNINKVNDPYESKSFDWGDIELEKDSILYTELEQEEALEDEQEIKEMEDEEAEYFRDKFRTKNYEASDEELPELAFDDGPEYPDEENDENDENDENEEQEAHEQLIFNYYSKRKYNEVKNRLVKTTCFCEGICNNMDDYEKSIPEKRPGFFYPRMWAQYGGKSTGCCIIFNKEKLKDLFSKLSDDYFIFDKAIEYFDILTVEHKKNINETSVNLPENLNKNAILDHLTKNVYLFYFCKDINWRDENEYRFLIINKINNDNKDPLYMGIEDAIEYIVLGENNYYDLGTIKDKCINNNIILYRLGNHIGDYHLVKIH
jgi:hypothetical protein